MPSGYIPQKDSLLVGWLDNFRDLIVAAPATYGLLAADGTTIASYVDAFDDAYALVTAPETKTKTTVASKDGAKAAALDIVRTYAQLIRRNVGVSNEDKTALGLTIPDVNPTPIPAPATQPVLSIQGATPGVLTIRYADNMTPDKRSKPFGAIGLQLWGKASATPIVDPAALEFQDFVTRQPFDLDVSDETPGQIMYLAGRWQTRTGLVGAWSGIVSFVVPA